MKHAHRFIAIILLALCWLVSMEAHTGAAKAMPDTKRQQIVDKVVARLARITIANQFATDIGTTPADDWPTRYTSADLRDATRLGVHDVTNTTTQSYPEEKKIPNLMAMQVRIYHARTTTPAQLRLMIEDVKRAVIEDETTGARDATFGGLAVDTKPESDGFVVPSDTFAIECAAVAFSVEFLTPPFDGYDLEA